ncbi:MAG: hypothetical protein V7676_13355 [Parasphingorhabdus sp.]|uniref:hypothetical protein n=1 Tax=Parasphingorhabdus sp. TaxID=2709688 RepID=UPI0030018DE8
MRKIIFALPLALMLAAPAAHSGTTEVKLSEKEQAKFDKIVAGRTAGKPVSCINRNDQRNMTVVGDKYLIYSSSGNSKTIYVNEPYGGCRNVDRNTLVTRKSSSQLCRGEIAQVKDLTNNMFVDSCSFSNFVPYTKIED